MTENGMRMNAHERTYSGFLSLLRYGAIATFVVVAIVVLIIAG